MDELTPKQIVHELDRYIIGQHEAKKAVAIALRNRYRRAKLPEEIKEEITPKNIIMKGPTGVGKTEIARRLAKIVKAPFVKVEATKFTEVGYVGRDVESIIRDLVEASLALVKSEKLKEVNPKAKERAVRKITAEILEMRKKSGSNDKSDAQMREEIASEILAGRLDNFIVEVEVTEQPKPLQVSTLGGQTDQVEFGAVLGSIFGANEKPKKKKLTVKQAMETLVASEADKMLDKDMIQSEALLRAEQDGVVFIDEIDKVASRNVNSGQHEVSREGVQRDILPIVEGSTVQTKYGAIKTDYILFIAAGAFHLSRVEDLIPELQGRFPIRVELSNLSEEDFVRILTEPDNAVLKQYKALLSVDGVTLEFADDAITEIARISFYENENSENLGARRLHAVTESILKDILFEADDNKTKKVVIDKKYIQKHLSKELRELDLSKYIL